MMQRWKTSKNTWN